MGETVRTGGEPCAELFGKPNDSGMDGCVYGGAAGSYVHGLFDSEEMQKALWEFLAKLKKLPAGWLSDAGQKTLSVDAYKEKQYDKMADVLRDSLNMDMIYGILDRKMQEEGYGLDRRA